MSDYICSIGLETHIELSTNSKIFCGCKSSFGAPPNTNCCPVCIGLPGTIPKLNEKAVEYAVKMGLALNCDISYISYMDRKNYIYPDLAKAYQISQYDIPLCLNGKIQLSDGSVIHIERIHIEEDAGKIVNEGEKQFVDYNRAGVPLIEIVTKPDFHDAKRAVEYLEKIRLIAKYLGISDCKMQEGSMRSDVNISVRKSCEKELGERTEIKNMSSFSNILKAVSYESQRQVGILQSGRKIERETLGFDENDAKTYLMRNKENQNDYRYFREPDLKPVVVSEEYVNTLKKTLPELPNDKLKRYTLQYHLDQKDAMHIIKYVEISKYFEALVELTKNPRMSSTIILTHIFRIISDDSEREEEIKVPAKYIAEVINHIQYGRISSNLTKKIVDMIFSKNKPLCDLFDIKDLAPIDNDAVLIIVKNVINNNPKIVQSYKNGKTKALAAAIGIVMKETNGRADAEYVKKIIIENM